MTNDLRHVQHAKGRRSYPGDQIAYSAVFKKEADLSDDDLWYRWQAKLEARQAFREMWPWEVDICTVNEIEPWNPQDLPHDHLGFIVRGTVR